MATQNIFVRRATLADLELIVPLFDAYRQFYEQAQDLALARELQSNAESHDKDEYAAFFFGQNSRPDLPPRGGYYVGYRVAQILGAGRTIQQLALLRGAKLKAAVMQALEQLATESGPLIAR